MRPPRCFECGRFLSGPRAEAVAGAARWRRICEACAECWGRVTEPKGPPLTQQEVRWRLSHFTQLAPERAEGEEPKDTSPALFEWPVICATRGDDMSMTKGEYRVGKSFNPSGDNMVDTIKTHAAAMIDLIEGLSADRETEVGNERGRLKAMAQTAIEDGAMWAVKAATKQAKE